MRNSGDTQQQPAGQLKELHWFLLKQNWDLWELAPVSLRHEGGGTLTWVRYGDADSLDPQRTTTTLSWQIFDQIYDTLLAFSDQGEVVPNLAKEWKISPDGKEITFILNQGVTCHDGTPFDAIGSHFTTLNLV